MAKKKKKSSKRSYFFFYDGKAFTPPPLMALPLKKDFFVASLISTFENALFLVENKLRFLF